MEIKINSFQQDLTFFGRKGGITQLQMLQKMPELLAKNTPLDEMSKETGRTPSSLLKWIKQNTGLTYKQHQLSASRELYKDKLVQLARENKSVNFIAKAIGKGSDWTRNRLKELGLYRTRKELNEVLEEQADKLISEGYSAVAIGEKLNVSQNKLRDWIGTKYNDNITEIRKKNKIRIKKEYSEETNLWKDELAKYLLKGMSISEISRITGRPCSRIAYWLNKFEFNTKNQIAHSKMNELVPQMMKRGMKLSEMAEEVGLSEATISRWIIKTYGKTYTDLRLCK